MLTRRRFLGTVAALAAGSRVAPAAVAAAPMVEWKDRLYTLPPMDGIRYVYSAPRRDDGDTLLELR
jgi:hypothetical protein